MAAVFTVSYLIGMLKRYIDCIGRDGPHLEQEYLHYPSRALLFRRRLNDCPCFLLKTSRQPLSSVVFHAFQSFVHTISQFSHSTKTPAYDLVRLLKQSIVRIKIVSGVVGEITTKRPPRSPYHRYGRVRLSGRTKHPLSVSTCSPSSWSRLSSKLAG